MAVRSFSHVGITVSDFNKFVTFYWEIFGCPLVGVADTPPAVTMSSMTMSTVTP